MSEDTRTPRKWRFAAIVAGVVMILLVPIGWLGAHRLRSASLPPPPWSARELPEIPAASENGMDDLVLAGGPLPLSRAEPDLIEWVDALEHQAPGDRWRDVVGAREAIATWMEEGADSGLRTRELMWIDAVLALPRFADPCGAVGTDCRMLEAMNLFRFAALADLDRGLDGDWPDAFARGAELLAASNEALITARTILGHMVSMVLARLATDHLRVLAAGYLAARAEGTVSTEPAELRPALDTITTALDALRREDVHARRALITECLWLRDGLQMALADPQANGAVGGPLAPYLLDARSTLVTSDDQFRALMRWLETPGHRSRPPPPIREHASGPGWWLWNPGGKMLLDLMAADVPALLIRFENEADALFVSRDALRREVRTLVQ